jgi:hypothetical protein
MLLKRVFILGDKACDTLLIPKKKSMVPSGTSDYYGQGELQEIKKSGGTHTIKGLLTAMNVFTVFDNPKSSDSLHTISMWSSKDICEECNSSGKGLFLTRRIGITDIDQTLKDERLITSNAQQLAKSDIVVIYNLSEKVYCSEQQLASIVSKTVQTVLFRTTFNPDKKTTRFFDLVCTTKDLSKKTILLFSVDDLRRAGFNIQKGISWEQLAIQTMAAIQELLTVRKTVFKAVVVCFNNEGCLVVLDSKATLYYYPEEIEADFNLKHNKDVFGTFATLKTSIVYALAHNSLQDITGAVHTGVVNGLATMRYLIKIGFKENAEFRYDTLALTIKKYYDDTNKNVTSIYPVCLDKHKGVACCSCSNVMKTERIYPVFQELNDVKGDYSIANQEINTLKEDSLLQICKQIVTKGKIAESKSPYLRYGKLLTYDKKEIEQLRDTYHLFCSYINNDAKLKKPISICVFGPPGAGKGFAVEQIVGSIDKTKKTEVLKFNISQMKGPDDLSFAFHQIRDVGLKEKLPIVFF